MNVIYELLPVSGTTALVALVALALGITAGAVGSFAVLQARSLVGDALAHAALPGIAVAFILSGARDPATLMIGAVVAAAVAAALILFLERTPRLRADAVIAVVLAGAFSAGVVLLTWISASGRGDQGGLESYLFGQAAGAVEADLITASVVMVSALLIVGVLARPLGAVIFDRAFSSSIGMPVRGLEAISVALLVLAVVVGLRMVGAILMVVMLIAPAVGARQLVKRLRPMIVLAALFGGAIAVTGALLSSALAVPTGPVIALVGTATAVLLVLIAPSRGVAWRARRRHVNHSRLRGSELLMALDGTSQTGPMSEEQLAREVGRNLRWVRRGVRSLRRSGLADPDRGAVALTEKGRARAAQDRREVAAWSAWIEHGWRLDLPDAREPDPLNMRRSLGEANLRQLAELGQEGRDRAPVR